MGCDSLIFLFNKGEITASKIAFVIMLLQFLAGTATKISDYFILSKQIKEYFYPRRKNLFIGHFSPFRLQSYKSLSFLQ